MELSGEGVRIEAGEGTLDADRIDPDDDSEETASADADSADGETDDGEDLISEVSFDASWDPPSEQSDAEE